MAALKERHCQKNNNNAEWQAATGIAVRGKGYLQNVQK